jgi:DNA-binding beta-propeller fold protein YncE/mono/diheme cytochrome c family protein
MKSSDSTPLACWKVCLPLLIGSIAVAAERSGLKETPQLRRPIAMVLADEGKWLLTANRASGSISIIDTAASEVVDEVAIGKQLADLAITPDQRRVLVLDEQAGQVIVLKRQSATLEVVERLAVGSSPVAVTISADGRRAYITSLWSRRLTAIELGESNAKVAGTLLLPFAPRELLLVRDDTRLIVADGYAGKLAIVDPDAMQLLHVRNMPAHNIRGLAISPQGDKLVVAHQILNDLAETTHNDVHWGVLMSNVVRWLVLDYVLDPQAQLLKESHVHLTGDSSTPGADPSGIAMAADGTALVALAGAHEVGMGREADYSLFRVPVGRRPTSIALAPDNTTAFVSNTFSDSVTLVRLQPAKIPAARAVIDIHLGPQPALGEVEKGEMLFYDATLALDGWYSCHSCHTDGHTNGLMSDTLGDRSFGAAKRVPTLLGSAHTGPWAWNGSMPTIEVQIRTSIRSTMQGSEPSPEQLAALAAYVRSLPPPPQVPEVVTAADESAIARGRQVFEAQGCVDCHRPPLYTSAEVYDVGLADKLGNRKFNPPSLLGVQHRDRLFHDNRAASLEEVFREHQHPSGQELTSDAISDLTSFLRSL